MITRITGTLTALLPDRAQIDPGGGLVYEVLLPSYAVARLGIQIDQQVSLETLHYLEGQNQGASFIPRLAGFLSAQDRAFFELFTTVKGIGPRKALRAMTFPTAQLAAAIADRDLATLQSMPEIGKRTAETIVVTLKDKVESFLSAPARVAAATRGKTAVIDDAPTDAPRGGIARDALEVLTQLGENRVQAATWIDQILARETDRPATADALVAEVYRLKSGR